MSTLPSLPPHIQANKDRAETKGHTLVSQSCAMFRCTGCNMRGYLDDDWLAGIFGEQCAPLKFRLRAFDAAESDVLGGAVGLNNAYIATYGTHVSGKHPADLAVGESCVKRYALSGQKPTDYKIVRVE